VESAKPTPSMYDGWAFENGIFTRTFDTAGGRAVVRVLEGRVELVSSAANPGYKVSVPSPQQPQRLVVRFDAIDRSTIVDCMWWESRPYAEVTNVGP
jgi:hypothetical protein